MHGLELGFIIDLLLLLLFFKSSPQDTFIDFRARGRKRDRRESETSIGYLFYVPRLVIEPATYICALTWELNPQHFGAWDNAPTN